MSKRVVMVGKIEPWVNGKRYCKFKYVRNGVDVIEGGDLLYWNKDTKYASELNREN